MQAECNYPNLQIKRKQDLRDEIEVLRQLVSWHEEVLDKVLSACDTSVLKVVEGLRAEVSQPDTDDPLASLQKKKLETLAKTMAGLKRQVPAYLTSGSSSSSNWSNSGSPASRVPATTPSSAAEDSDNAKPGTQRVYPGTARNWPIQTVFDVLRPTLLWDILPFCFIYKETFIQDLFALETQHCSPALVNALLAVALSTSASPLHVDFFNESYTLVQAKSPESYTLPDIQALGVLSLYQMSRNEPNAAQHLASTFAIAMTGHFTTLRPSGTSSKAVASMRSMAYYGAISLCRSVSGSSSSRGWITNKYH